MFNFNNYKGKYGMHCKTIEDLYESCCVYMCGQMGVSQESDDSFKAWDKVRSEFLNPLQTKTKDKNKEKEGVNNFENFNVSF